MLRPNQAVRLGLRAASRNPELAFGKALIDQGGTLLALLPAALAALLLFAAAQEDLLQALRAALVVGWPLIGGIAAAVAVAATLSLLFWAGALPLLAADAEMGLRPPAGNFLLLLSRGAGRTVAAGALAWALELLFSLACGAGLAMGGALLLRRPSLSLFALLALLGAVAVLGSVLLDLVTRLTLIRAAAFGDGALAALSGAASLLASRLGACLVVTAAFLFLELIAGTAAGMFTGLLPGAFDPRVELLAFAPRLAVGLAAAAVFAWLEVGRMGALAALAADEAGLIEPGAGEPPPVAELVVEALPADDSAG